MSNEAASKQLCLELAHAETEDEVIKILKKNGYWDDEKSWSNYGGYENNFSVIGNQQSTAEAALVEKIVNSVDAVLMRECLKKGIRPDGENAPKTIDEALQNFFGIFKGKLTNADPRTRTRLGENILLVASGGKTNPSYSIIDRGEGQSPQRIPDTFLSLSKSNKLRIPFVQGKFNQGGTGALQFCGRHNIQLIISRRNPEIAKLEKDPTNQFWGFTVVRREDPKQGVRSSTFKYLAPNNEILKFSANSLPLLPQEYPTPRGGSLESGSFIKMYEYDLRGGLKSVIVLDLYFRLSLLMPTLALPVTLVERREGYRAHSYQAVMSGLSVRLDEDKSENLEEGFPNSSEVQANGEKMKILLYAFKKDKAENYAPRDGIIFVLNGQAQGFIPRSFYERRTVNMSYLKDSILVIVDCSELTGRTREDLFMNSRDRLRDGNVKEQIESQLEDLIRDHPGLRELREKRRREEMDDVLKEAKPIAEVLNKIIKNSPTLSQLLILGTKIRNPLNLLSVSNKPAKFIGKRYPTFFRLNHEYPLENPKLCHLNSTFRVQFETDADNEYFERDNDPGDFRISINGSDVDAFIINLWNGLATLTIDLPIEVKIGDCLEFKTETSDSSKVVPFKNAFYITIVEELKPNEGGNGSRSNPPREDRGSDREIPNMLALPNVKECHKTDGDTYEFKRDEEGALIVKSAGEEGYDFFVNMDNSFLRTEQKALRSQNHKLLEARFKFGMVLVGLMTLNSLEKISKDNMGSESESIYEKVYFFTKAISPVLLPMISSLGDLEIN